MNPNGEQGSGPAVGDRVWIERLKDHGVVLSLSRNGARAVVATGKVNLNVPVAGLGPPRKTRAPEPEGAVVRQRSRQPGRPVSEIDMHGLRVEEMISRLEAFLNEALLAGCVEARVIHGHGSGALRKALHQHLRKLGLRNFRLGESGQTPGGDGVTIVSL